MASPSAPERCGVGCMKPAIAGSGLATSMPGERRIWPRKRGSGPAPEGGLASGRRAAVPGLDAAAAVPPLRATWALTGTQAVVPITGANAKRVLFGAIDL